MYGTVAKVAVAVEVGDSLVSAYRIPVVDCRAAAVEENDACCVHEVAHSRHT